MLRVVLHVYNVHQGKHMVAMKFQTFDETYIQSNNIRLHLLKKNHNMLGIQILQVHELMVIP